MKTELEVLRERIDRLEKVVYEKMPIKLWEYGKEVMKCEIKKQEED